MTDLEYIVENLSEEDILCQISEEAAELAQAALKLRRAMTQTNPTTVSVKKAADDLMEEYGDTVVAYVVYAVKSNWVDCQNIVVGEIIRDKYNRWAQRIKEGKKHGD